MRGAFYVTTALLITNSIRTTAESNQTGHRPTSHHDGVVPGSMETESSPRRFLRGSREQHDDLAFNAADEERMPEASTRIIGDSLTSVSEEVLDTVRKAVHLSFDLNAPPEEIPTGALEAYNILRNKDSRTYTASDIEALSSRPSNKRTAEALTNSDKASGSAISNKGAVPRPKRLRKSAYLGEMEAQSSTGRGKMTATPSILSVEDRKVHNSYLEHLKRKSAGFEPTELEMKKLLRLLGRVNDSRPNVSSVYKREIEKWKRMDFENLKKLVFDSTPVPGEPLKKMLTLSLAEHNEIQLCFLRLLRLKRWVRMYRDFFSFCLSNHQVCGKFDPESTLLVELRVMEKAKSGTKVGKKSTRSRLKKTKVTSAERKLFIAVVVAVEKANLSESDKMAWYQVLDLVYRDDAQLIPPNLAAHIAEISNGQSGEQLKNLVLKTPLKTDRDEWSNDRQKITKLLEEATKRVQKTKKRRKKAVKAEVEESTFTEIRENFMKYSGFLYEPTHEATQKMWNMARWKVKPNPQANIKAGLTLKEYVCRLDREKLEKALGPDRVRAALLSEAGQKDPLLELKTEYLVLLLQTYDQFYSFFMKNRSKLPSMWFTKSRPEKETRTSIRRDQLLDRVQKRQKTS